MFVAEREWVPGKVKAVGDVSIRGFDELNGADGYSVGRILRGLAHARGMARNCRRMDDAYVRMADEKSPDAMALRRKIFRGLENLDLQFNRVVVGCSDRFVWQRIVTGKGPLYSDADVIDVVCNGTDKDFQKLGADLLDTLAICGNQEDLAACAFELIQGNESGTFGRGIVDRDDFERVSSSMVTRWLDKDMPELARTKSLKDAHSRLNGERIIIGGTLGASMGVFDKDAARRITKNLIKGLYVLEKRMEAEGVSVSPEADGKASPRDGVPGRSVSADAQKGGVSHVERV